MFPRKRNQIIFQGNLVSTKGERKHGAEKKVKLVSNYAPSYHWGYPQHQYFYLPDKKQNKGEKTFLLLEQNHDKPLFTDHFRTGKVQVVLCAADPRSKAPHNDQDKTVSGSHTWNLAMGLCVESGTDKDEWELH